MKAASSCVSIKNKAFNLIDQIPCGPPTSRFLFLCVKQIVSSLSNYDLIARQVETDLPHSDNDSTQPPFHSPPPQFHVVSIIEPSNA